MSTLPDKYPHLLSFLKDRVRAAKRHAVLSVNKELLSVYWLIGKTIEEQQKLEGWGSKVIEQLSKDLSSEFPDMKGFSSRNLLYMRQFAEAYTITQPVVAQLQTDDFQSIEFAQPLVAQIPWTHHTVILNKCKSTEERLFYVSKTAEQGWSKNILSSQIETQLYKRQGQAISNFSEILPQDRVAEVSNMIKNPYVFDFLDIREDMQERDMERALVEQVKKLMLELGKGFAFVGNQYNIKVENDDYYLDLLFFNILLNCYVVFELKIGDFRPEYIGKLNFYVNAVDGEVKLSNHNDTIGVLLCKTPNKTEIKYSLKNVNAPIGVSEYLLHNQLPSPMREELPTDEAINNALNEEWTKQFPQSEQKLHEMIAKKLRKEFEAKFETIQLMIWAGSKGFYEADLEELKSFIEKLHYGIDNVRIDVRLNVFRPAGKNAFDVHSELEVLFCRNKYVVRNNISRGTYLEKLYSEFPSQEEQLHTIDAFISDIVTDIDKKVSEVIKHDS
ncbi:MAG: PDDEXK nuclease domain-containing protein [Bacteroidales bacterium]|nr:PDDEXK nuclease domain-containing protein [Bacteroidales bacterium]